MAWNPFRPKPAPAPKPAPKPAPTPAPAPKQSPANNYFNTPTTTIGSGGLQSTTPVQQATGGKVQSVTPSRGGGGSSSSSGGVAGPMPAGTTPAQEAEFRKTGSVSTPIVKPITTTINSSGNRINTSVPTSPIQTQSVMNTYTPKDFDNPYFLNKGYAIKEDIKKLPQNVLAFLRGESKTIAPALAISGKWKPDTTAYYTNPNLPGTTAIVDPMTGRIVQTRGVTYGDIQNRNLEIEKLKNPDIAQYLTTNPAQTNQNIQVALDKKVAELKGFYQTKVNNGEIGIDVATSNFNEQTQQLYNQADATAKKAFEISKKFDPSIYVNTGQAQARAVTSAGLFGASFIPPLAPVLIASGGMNQNTEVLTAGLFAGGGSVFRQLTNIPKEITASRLATAQNSKALSITRQIYTKGDETFLIQRSIRGNLAKQGAQFESKTQFPLFRQADGSFKVGEGSGKLVTRYYDFARNAPYDLISKAENFNLRGNIIPTTATRGRWVNGIRVTTPLPEELNAFRGSALINRGEKLTNFNFGGFGKDINENIAISKSGSISKLRLYADGRKTAIVNPKDMNIFKKFGSLDINPPSGGTSAGEGGGFSFFKGGEKVVQLLAKQEQTQILASGFSSAVNTQVTQQIVKEATQQASPSLSSSLFGSLVRGGGSLTRVDTRTSLMPSLILKEDVLVKEKTKMQTPVINTARLLTIERVKTKTAQVPAISTLQLLEQPLQLQQRAFIPSLITPFKFAPRLDIPSTFFGMPILPNLGEIQTGGGGRSREERTGLFGKTKYNPSLGSVLLRTKAKKVTAKEYERLSGLKFSGLGLREQVEISNKKKKKGLGLL